MLLSLLEKDKAQLDPTRLKFSKIKKLGVMGGGRGEGGGEGGSDFSHKNGRVGKIGEAVL